MFANFLPHSLTNQLMFPGSYSDQIKCTVASGRIWISVGLNIVVFRHLEGI